MSIVLNEESFFLSKNVFEESSYHSRNGILLFVFRVKQLQHIEKTAQIIDVERFQEKFNTAHICPEGRLKFVPDTNFAVGLLHQNSLECSKCHKRTDLSNFPCKHPIRSTVQEPNAHLYNTKPMKRK